MHRWLLRRWTGSRAALDRCIRAFLRGRDRAYLLRLVRKQAFALAVTGALLAGSQGHASSPIELSDVAAGTSGFVINGIDIYDNSGYSVSGAGDVNGDGLDDLIVGAIGGDPGGDNLAGESYVVFGKADGTAVELSIVASGTGGFVINGDTVDDFSGFSVSAAGDVNGDGLDDLIIGAPYADLDPMNQAAGKSYVVFGKSDGTAVNLSNVAAGTGGFVMIGELRLDESGLSVSGAGDVNGDGLADLIIGARYAGPVQNSKIGRGYVVFGKADGTAVELSSVAAGIGGFLIEGQVGLSPGGGLRSVSGAGDVNGDGFDDLILGDYRFDANGNNTSGLSYVVFGKANGTVVNLSSVAAGNGGFGINGQTAGDDSGFSVSGAGDVNGDGLADLIIGAPRADPNGLQSGKSYVVFGKVGGAAVELATVTAGTGGFVMNGEAAGDYSGFSVSGAGDLNGDGLADVIVGALYADPNGLSSGKSYVVFGKADGAAVEFSAVAAGTGGFVMNGIDAGDYSGNSVSGAGDVNGDGLLDLIVGAALADPGGEGAAGESYVVFSSTALRFRVSNSSTGDPITDATVSLERANAPIGIDVPFLRIDGNGEAVYAAAFLDPEDYDYTVHAPGFEVSATLPVTLALAEVLTFDVALLPDPNLNQLNEISVTIPLSGSSTDVLTDQITILKGGLPVNSAEVVYTPDGIDIIGLPSGQIDLSVTALPSLAIAPASVVLGVGARADIVLPATPTGSIGNLAGFVRNSNNGDSNVALARIVATLSDTESYEQVTNITGTYSFVGIPSGTYAVTAYSYDNKRSFDGGDNNVVPSGGSIAVNFSVFCPSDDADCDGIRDSWEIEHFAPLGDNILLVDPSVDSDGDGLSNLLEFLHGTDPNVADTDGDGIDDGTEVELGRDPTIDESTPVVLDIAWVDFGFTDPIRSGNPLNPFNSLADALAAIITDGSGIIKIKGDGIQTTTTEALPPTSTAVEIQAINGSISIGVP